MKPSMSLTGEHESHKVAAVFETESDANGTAKALCNETSLTNDQVSVLSPADRRQEKNLNLKTRVSGRRLCVPMWA